MATASLTIVEQWGLMDLTKKTQAGLSGKNRAPVKRWSPEEDQQLIAQYNAGRDDYEIAGKLQVTYHQVVHRRRVLGLPRVNRHFISDTSYWGVTLPKPDLQPGDMVKLTPKVGDPEDELFCGNDSWGRFRNPLVFDGIEDGVAPKWIFRSTVGYKITMTLAQLQDYEIEKVSEDADTEPVPNMRQ